MDTDAYLRRIHFRGDPALTVETLFNLHRHHIFHVPFENLSIHSGERIVLTEEELFAKVVTNCRGGFCYELNYLFHILLQHLGYSSTMVSARIYNEGVWGPEYDHLSLIVALNDRRWLLDVGYGDLFLEPLAFDTTETQTDGRSYFKLEGHGSGEIVLSMSADNRLFEKRYWIDPEPRRILDFTPACIAKQRDADSYFVKNLVCTKPLPHGRVTLFNDKLICKEHGQKQEEFIRDGRHLRELVGQYFGMALPGKITYPLLTL